MLDKLVLSDKDYEYLTKGIAGGVGIGILLGVIVGNITLTFAVGGVIGTILAVIYLYYKKSKKQNEVKN